MVLCVTALSVFYRKGKRYGKGINTMNVLIVQTTGDQELLWSFRNDEDWNVRLHVAERIEDQDRLLRMRVSETARSIIRSIDDRLYKLACVASEDTV